MENSEDSFVIPYLLSKLGIKGDHVISKNQSIDNFYFDLTIVDKQTGITYYVLQKQRANVDSLAQINFYKDIIESRSSKVDKRFVLATRKAMVSMYELANTLGILIVDMPFGLSDRSEPRRQPQSKLKITSEKSWMIATALLKEKTSSIRALSLNQNVSYGWAYATINNLLDKGVVKKNDSWVSIADVGKLLNGVAWERPTLSLVKSEVKMGGGNVFDAARKLSEILDDLRIKYAIACYLAGTMYTGYGVRYDSLQIYIEEKRMGEVSNYLYNDSNYGTISVQFLSPDRDVFRNLQVRQGLKITSPSQTLLDLAGLGHRSGDMTKAMADMYNRL
jgi:hypothetical protein